MTGMSRVSFATLLACAALALAAASAAADGLPVVVDGSSGVVSSDGASRFVTLAVGARHTVIERLKLHTGEVARYRTLPGSWSIPAVAYDGTGSGLSSDGRTLVVIRNRTRFPQRRTYLAVVDPVRLRIERRLALRGDFSFDAISPDGSTVYLINYLSARDPTRYAVRAFDVARGRLLPGAIVDPHEPGEQMGGVPITRTTSPDGRWAYTLYAGNDHPFVHALDTSGRTARCVDIGALAGRQDLFAIRMKTTPGGDRLTIASQDGRPLAVLDARTFRVSEPVRAPAAAKAAAPGQDARPWLVPAGLALLLLLLTGAGYAGRNRMLARAARAR
jgi:hypothetical protein